MLTRSLLKVDKCLVTNADFSLTMHGYSSHTYQLQYRDDLGTGSWQNISSPVNGADAVFTLTHSSGVGAGKRCYRVSVSP